MADNETNLYKHISAAILAGGKSSRMGTNKAVLLWENDTLLGHAIGLMADFPEVLVSVAKKTGYNFDSIRLVMDQKKGYGPLEGIYQILKAAAHPWVFITAVDMPRLNRAFIQKMLQQDRRNICAIVPQAQGQVHPLCALYHKDILPVLEQAFSAQQHSLKYLLDKIPHHIVDIHELGETPNRLTNLNTITEYTDCLKQNQHKSPQLLCICGVKNSGKTTLMERLIKTFYSKGYKVAAIKHDGHDFDGDVPGTDSYRMRLAGAYGTAIFSDHRFLVYKEWPDANEKTLIDLFPESDIIIIEGLKQSPYPKLELIRNGNSDRSVADTNGLQALVSDIPMFSHKDYPVLDLNDTDGIVSYLLEHVFRLE
jgi:molybdopterin-guanine dinucleotide biosynthesis protein MobB